MRALLSERDLTLGDFHAEVRRYRPSLAWRTLSEVVNEKRRPSLPVVQAMAEALGVVPDYLLDLTDDPQGSTELGVIAERDIAPVVDRLNSLPPDKRKQMGAIIDGILALAGQPAVRIVGDAPAPKVAPVQEPGRQFEEMGEMSRLERVLVQELSRLSPDELDDAIRVALTKLRGGANSGAPTRSSVNQGTE